MFGEDLFESRLEISKVVFQDYREAFTRSSTVKRDQGYFCVVKCSTFFTGCYIGPFHERVCPRRMIGMRCLGLSSLKPSCCQFRNSWRKLSFAPKQWGLQQEAIMSRRRDSRKQMWLLALLWGICSILMSTKGGHTFIMCVRNFWHTWHSKPI